MGPGSQRTRWLKLAAHQRPTSACRKQNRRTSDEGSLDKERRISRRMNIKGVETQIALRKTAKRAESGES